MTPISLELQYHLDRQLSITNNVFRYGSTAWAELIREARSLYNAGELTEVFEEDIETFESDMAEEASYNGEAVLLETPQYDWTNECWVVYIREGVTIRQVVLPRYAFE
jgi:hypothetical protein